MSSDSPKKRVGLVIGAGSIKCIASLGILKVLEREGIDIDLVVGCSGGSLYASCVALGWDAQTAEQRSKALWTREITQQRNRKAILEVILPKLLGFDGRFGLLNDHLIMERIRAAYGETTTFADAKIPLYIITTDLMNGEQVVLNDGNLVDAIRGSIAIPFVFKPWPVNGRLMVDGGVANPMPVDVAIREGAEIIIALGFEGPLQRRIGSVIQFAFQVTTIMTNHLLKSNFAFQNLVHHTEIITIIPEFEERIGSFDTTKVPYLIERGEAAMAEQLPYLKRLLGTQDGDGGS
jgi:NTE family protein